MSKERIIHLRERDQSAGVSPRDARPLYPAAGGGDPALQCGHRHRVRSLSELVEKGVDLGASPRAIICWGRLAKVWTLLERGRTEVYPEDIQDLAPYVLGHRLWLGPHAASHGLTTEAVIQDIIERVPIP